MDTRLLHESAGQRTFALVFDTGDDVMTGLQAFARRERLQAASFTAIGAFDRVVLGYFRLETRDYDRIPLDEQAEVLARPCRRRADIRATHGEQRRGRSRPTGELPG